MSERAQTAADDEIEQILTVATVDDGTRLDVYINTTLGWNSRGKIKELIKLGVVRVNDDVVKPSFRVRAGDSVAVHSEPPPPPDHLLAEDIPLDVIYEDATLIVIDKAPFMPVHPGAGRRTGTIANALAHRFERLSGVGGPLRPGIVHRLDRDTTGALCVAKTDRAHYSITSQFHDRTVSKTYLALAEGVMEYDEYAVDEPIGRHPHNPIKMAVVEGGRPSSTRFEVIDRFDGFTWVRCFPKTGRTHQIRVHLLHLGHPIVCDRLYGRRTRLTLGELAALGPDDPDDRMLLERQALHAHTLALFHPLRGERVEFEAPLASDIQEVLNALRDTRRADGQGR